MFFSFEFPYRRPSPVIDDWAQVVEFDSLRAPSAQGRGMGWSTSGTQKGGGNWNGLKGYRRKRGLKDVLARPQFTSDQYRALALGHCSHCVAREAGGGQRLLKGGWKTQLETKYSSWTTKNRNLSFSQHFVHFYNIATMWL